MMEQKQYVCPKCGNTQYEHDQFQATGGNFSRMSSFTDADWDAIRGLIKSTNEKDKAKRAV